MVHETETNSYDGLYVSYAKLFVDHKVSARFGGMTWEQFIKLTKDEVDIIIDICIGETDRELTEQKKMTEEFNNLRNIPPIPNDVNNQLNKT